MRSVATTEPRSGRDHVVRPRWVWSGLATALVGSCLLAAWFATWRIGFCWSGAALLVLGCAAGLRGGALYDVHGAGSATDELAALVEGRRYRGTVPGQMVDDEAARRDALRTSSTTATVQRQARRTRRPHLNRIAAVGLLLAAGFLVSLQGRYPQTPTGKQDAVRALIVSVLAAIAGLRILVGQRPGWGASILGAVAGVALIGFALLLPHDRAGMATVEVVVGAWIVLVAAVTLDRPKIAPADARGSARSMRTGATSDRRARGPISGAAVLLALAAVLVGHLRRTRQHSEP